MFVRTFGLALLVVAVCGLSTARQAQQPKPSQAEEEVRKLELQWLDAY